jgi:Zn-dependent protease with chaperone function
LLERATPVLLCAGALHPVLVVSRGALHALDGDELRAALAHELGHVARRDPLASWVLMAARAVMFFNPAFQVVARLLARDAEWRADDDAVAATGGGLALASGLIKLYRTSEGRRRAPRLAWLPSLDGPLARLRTEAVAARCHRLIDGAGSRPLPLARTRLGLTAAALSLLLFFVV